MNYKAKILLNEKNKQLVVHLSRKKLELLKKKNPKYLNIDEKDLEF